MSAAAGTPIVRLQTLALEGPAGAIEAVLQEREGTRASIVAVVCHPHPLYGGTLHNKVTHRVAGTLLELGAVVLRFNFRGVSRSEGRYDHGHGELEDARAMLRWVATRHPQARRWVAGFSFGSWVVARLAASDPDVERMLLVAPPVGTQDFSAMRTCATPKHVWQGTADDICPLARLEVHFPEWAEPKTLRLVPDASHFFDKQLQSLADAMREVLSPLAGATGSTAT